MTAHTQVARGQRLIARLLTNKITTHARGVQQRHSKYQTVD